MNETMSDTKCYISEVLLCCGKMSPELFVVFMLRGNGDNLYISCAIFHIVTIVLKVFYCAVECLIMCLLNGVIS